MSFGGLILTNNGRNKMAAAISEKNALKFTHIQLGDGTFNGSYSSKSELSHMVMEIPVTRVQRKDNEVLIECDWNSKQAPTAFYLREIGIIGNGALCYYDNVRSGDAEYIDPKSEVIAKQKRFRFTISVTDDVEITTMISSGLYALAEDVETLKKSVSDGKKAVAAAITGMGVTTATDDSFEVIEGNIKKISADTTAVASEILTNKTAFSKGAKVTGTMANNGAVSQELSAGGSYTVPTGYHNGSGKVTAKSLAAQTGVDSGKTAATAVQILTGYQAWVNGNKVTGTMANNTNAKKTLTGSNNSAGNGGLSISGTVMRVVPPTGYCDYSGSSWENGLQITVGNAGTGDVVAGKTFTSSAGLNKRGTIIDARKTDAVFIGCGFNLGVNTPDFAARNISHVSYQQFSLRCTASTSSAPAPTEYAAWNCPYISIPNLNNVHVYRSGWTIDTTNYSKMIVLLYGKTNNTGVSLGFRGHVSLIAPTGASSTGGEGSANSLAFVAYKFNNTSDNWLSPIEMSLSNINQVVQFQISTVHAGDVRVQSVIFVPNAK